MPKNPKYDSSRDRTNYTFHPGRRFNLQWDTEPGPCYLFALDERQAAMLRKMVQVFPKYHWVWGLPSPRKDWDAATWQLWEDISNFVDELEACLVSGCEVQDLLKVGRMIVAAIVGEAVTLDDNPDLVPDAVDYTGGGLFPGLSPQLDVLHNRFRMSDSSIFNPLDGEKNIVEALETQLRVDKLIDLEFLTPNIATIMNQVMKIDSNNPLVSLFNDMYEWVTGSPAPDVEFNTVAELLLLIASSQQQQSSKELEIVESLAELKKIRKTLEVSIDDGQGSIIFTDLAGIANRIAITLDRLRDNLDVVSDDGKEFGMAAIAHYYGAESIERIDRIRDNLDTYIASEDKEFGIAALLDGLNRLSLTSTEYLRCIAEAMNTVCPPNVDPPTLPYSLVEGDTEEDDWFVEELKRIRAEDIANDPDEGRDELEDDIINFFFGAVGGILVSITATYETPAEIEPYVSVEIQTTGRMESLLVWATGGYRLEHSIIPDGAESPVVYQFNIYPDASYDLPSTGTVHVQDLENDDTLIASWS